MYTETHQTSLLSILIVNGLSKREAGTFYWFLRNAEKKAGIKWVVASLKARFSELLQPENKYNQHIDGTWRGAFRPISRLSRTSRRGLRRALRILKLHGLFTASEPIEADYLLLRRRLASNPEKKYEGSFSTTFQPELLEQAHAVFLKSNQYDSQYPIRTTTVPLTPTSSKAEVFVTPQEHLRTLDYCPRLVLNHYEYIYELVGQSLPSKTHFSDLIPGSRNDAVGRITLLTKDRGLKLRPVVNPTRIVQLGCSRLARVLYSWLDASSSSWITDQEGGAKWVHEQLREGVKLTSLDLTAASDNIPLSPQIAMAKALFPELHRDLDFFFQVNRCDWWTPFSGLVVKHKRGSGMGVHGGFPLFCLFLHEGLRSARLKLQDFAIVGDDLVFNAGYTDAVTIFLERFGIPINRTKSILRANIAEFVGRLIDPYGNMYVFKASELDLENDPLGLIRQYGPSALRKTHMRTYTTKAFKKRLLFYQEIVSDKRARALIALFLNNKAQKRKIHPQTSPVYHAGGIPTAIWEALIASVPDEYQRSTYAFLRPLGEVANHQYEGWLTRNRLCLPSNRGLPKYLINSWSFGVNPIGLRRLYRQLAADVSLPIDVDELATKRVPFAVEKHLNSGLLDVRKTEALALFKSALNEQKETEHRVRKGVTPASYIESFVRLSRWAFSKVRLAIGRKRPP